MNALEPKHEANHCWSCRRAWSRCDLRDAECARHRYAEALCLIAAGEIDDGGNRRNHPHATAIARSALQLVD